MQFPTLKPQSNDASRMIQKKCLVYIVQGGVDLSPRKVRFQRELSNIFTKSRNVGKKVKQYVINFSPRENETKDGKTYTSK